MVYKVADALAQDQKKAREKEKDRPAEKELEQVIVFPVSSCQFLGAPASS